MEAHPKGLTAAAVGAGVGLIAFLVNYYHIRKERESIHNEISLLKRDVSELRRVVTTLRSQNNEDEQYKDSKLVKKRNNNRRRMRSLQNGYESDATVSTMYTAIETDDDEFYDVSSDENDTLIQSLQEISTNNESNFFEEVDNLLKQDYEAVKEALNLLLARHQHVVSDPNILWRLSKAYKLQADAIKEKNDKNTEQALIELGIQYGRKAVELDGTNGNAHKWLAINLGMHSDFLATQDKVHNGIAFYNHLNLALETLPNDYTLFYLLARYKFAVASMSWFERNAAKMFGNLPDANMEEAVADALTAEELSHEPWLDNRLLLAKIYIAKGDYAKGLEWLDKAKALSSLTAAVKNEIEQLEERYKKYKTQH